MPPNSNVSESEEGYTFITKKFGSTTRTSIGDADVPDEDATASASTSPGPAKHTEHSESATRHGLRSKDRPNYDTKFHPMDVILRRNHKRTIDHLEKSRTAAAKQHPAVVEASVSGADSVTSTSPEPATRSDLCSMTRPNYDTKFHLVNSVVRPNSKMTIEHVEKATVAEVDSRLARSKTVVSVSTAATSEPIVANSSDEDEPQFDNLFSKPIYSDWHDLLSLDRRLYMLQRGAPLKGNAIPLKWDKVVKILVNEHYFTRIEYQNWGGLPCLKDRYERICDQMRRLYEAEKETGDKKNWNRLLPKNHATKLTRRSVLDSGKRGKCVVITTLTDQPLSIRAKSKDVENSDSDGKMAKSGDHNASLVLPPKPATPLEENSISSDEEASQSEEHTSTRMELPDGMKRVDGESSGTDTESTAPENSDSDTLDEKTIRALPPKREQMRAGLEALAGKAFKRSMTFHFTSLNATDDTPESITHRHLVSIASSFGHSQAYDVGMAVLQSPIVLPDNLAPMSSVAHSVSSSAAIVGNEPTVDPRQLLLNASPPDPNPEPDSPAKRELPPRSATSPTVSSIDPIAMLPQPNKVYGKKRPRVSASQASSTFEIFEDPPSHTHPTAKRRKVAVTPRPRVIISPDKENAHAGESSPDLSSRQVLSQLRVAEQRSAHESREGTVTSANSLADVVIRSVEGNGMGISEIGRAISESASSVSSVANGETVFGGRNFSPMFVSPDLGAADA